MPHSIGDVIAAAFARDPARPRSHHKMSPEKLTRMHLADLPIAEQIALTKARQKRWRVANADRLARAAALWRVSRLRDG